MVGLVSLVHSSSVLTAGLLPVEALLAAEEAETPSLTPFGDTWHTFCPPLLKPTGKKAMTFSDQL